MKRALGKKGAIELSMNTIIIVVIGITILTLGLRWIYGIFGGLTDQSTQIEQISQDQINELFGSQSATIIKLPASIINVQKGRTNNAQVFIRNIYSTSQTFKYTVTIDEGTIPTGSVNWYKNEVKLASGEGFKDFIRFNTKNLPLGVYSFRINVICMDCGPPENIPPAPLILEVVAK